MNANTVQDILDGQYGMTLVFDDTGALLFISPRGVEELGFQSQGTNICQICAPMFSEKKDISARVARMKGRELHTVVYRANGTSFSGLVRCARIRITEDVSTNVATIFNLQKIENAIVKLVKAESQIKASIKSRNEFVANVTHELRTPVNGIKGHITNLLEQEDNPEHKKIMDIILQCCSNMEKIISNMLDFSKIEAGKFEITEAPFDIRQCVKSVVDTNIASANGKGITLSSYVSDEIPQTLVGDDLRVGQILNNLVSNAIKFTSIGYVRIEVYCTMQTNNQAELTFFVIDTGIGVTPSEKEKMFKSFSQVDGSATRQFGGTGLGLYVSKQLIDLMRGTIELESEKGKGSTFRFTLLLDVDGGNESKPEIMEKISLVDQLREEVQKAQDALETESFYQFGTKENQTEIARNTEKLILCIEMENWEKAEQFAANLKKLCEGAPKEVKNRLFRMQMFVRKEDYQKSLDGLQKVTDELGKVMTEG